MLAWHIMGWASTIACMHMPVMLWSADVAGAETPGGAGWSALPAQERAAWFEAAVVQAVAGILGTQLGREEALMNAGLDSLGRLPAFQGLGDFRGADLGYIHLRLHRISLLALCFLLYAADIPVSNRCRGAAEGAAQGDSTGHSCHADL